MFLREEKPPDYYINYGQDVKGNKI